MVHRRDGGRAWWRRRADWLRAACACWICLVAGMTLAQSQPAGQHARDTMLAQQAFDRSNGEVERLERGVSAPDAVAQARMSRSDLVMAWRRQADAWAAAEPASPDARSAVAASERAMDLYYVPGGGFAPGPGNDP